MKTTQTLDDQHHQVDDRTPAQWNQWKANQRFNRWLVVWVVVYFASAVLMDRNDFGVTQWLDPTMLVLLIGAGFGLGVAYLRVIQSVDELQRKIELDSLAVGYGVGVLGGFTYSIVVATGWLERGNILYVPVAMIAAHTIARWVGHRRYR